MSPEAQRIAIAQACGLEVLTNANPDAWNRGYFTPSAAKQRHKSWPGSAAVRIIPDYLNDLNAMHEAEKILPKEKRRGAKGYMDNLWTIVSGWDGGSTWDICHATASQRAEAFLKTLNLWGF